MITRTLHRWEANMQQERSSDPALREAQCWARNIELGCKWICWDHVIHIQRSPSLARIGITALLFQFMPFHNAHRHLWPQLRSLWSSGQLADTGQESDLNKCLRRRLTMQRWSARLIILSTPQHSHLWLKQRSAEQARLPRKNHVLRLGRVGSRKGA